MDVYCVWERWIGCGGQDRLEGIYFQEHTAKAVAEQRNQEQDVGMRNYIQFEVTGEKVN